MAKYNFTYLLTYLLISEEVDFQENAINEDGESAESMKSAKDDSAKSSMFLNVRMVIIFYQTQFFLKVPSNENARVFDHVHNLLASLFSFQFGNERSNSFGIHICHNKNFTSVEKKWLSLFACVFPIILSITIYIVAQLMKQTKLKLKAQRSATQLITLTFIPIATNLFELVHCVSIYEDNVEIKVLFSQADIVCTQFWQYIIYGVIAVWIAPMVLTMCLAAEVCQVNGFDFLMYMLFLPPTTVYILLTKTVTLYRNCHDGKNGLQSTHNVSVQMNEDENETNVDVDVTTPNVQLLISSFEQSSTTSVRIENNEQEHEQQIDEEKAREEILNIILGPSDVQYWPGVIHMRNVLLTVIFVWCDLFVLRIYGLILVLAIYLILLQHKKPYKGPLGSLVG